MILRPSSDQLGTKGKIVSMIRKYNNHKLQMNPWHREEEPHNNHATPGSQTKQSNKLFLRHPTMEATVNNESTTTEPLEA